MAVKNYVYLNENPMDRKTGDCAVRAMATVTGKSWEEVYLELFKISIKEKYSIASKEAIGIYLKNLGFKKHGQLKHSNGKMYTVNEFTKTFNKGTYLVLINKHMTTVIDGIIYDTGNCGAWCLRGFWEKTN